MRTADLIYADVMPRLPGAPMPLVEAELLRTAQDLCRRTRCWTAWTDPAITVAGETEYEADTPEQASVELVLGMTVDGRPANVLPWQWLDRSLQDQDRASVVSTGRLKFYTTPAMGAGRAIAFHLVLFPRDESRGIPDEVFDPNRQVLADGVIARCALLPGQPFSNPQLAMAHGTAYAAAVDTMAVRMHRGGTNAMPRSRLRWC